MLQLHTDSAFKSCVVRILLWNSHPCCCTYSLTLILKIQGYWLDPKLHAISIPYTLNFGQAALSSKLPVLCKHCSSLAYTVVISSYVLHSYYIFHAYFNQFHPCLLQLSSSCTMLSHSNGHSWVIQTLSYITCLASCNSRATSASQTPQHRGRSLARPSRAIPI